MKFNIFKQYLAFQIPVLQITIPNHSIQMPCSFNNFQSIDSNISIHFPGCETVKWNPIYFF